MTSASTSIICFMIAAVSLISAVLNVGDWYGFTCLILALVFATVGTLLVKSP
jgi:hypothetical protein